MANLDRFLSAQQNSFQHALSEIKNGKKQSHWMWYVFPQIHGLGQSETAKLYAIKDLSEAREFLSHPILGARLMLICKELLQLKSNDPYEIFGHPDDLKLQSSMTLFAAVKPNATFTDVLTKFYNGKEDARTHQLLKSQ